MNKLISVCVLALVSFSCKYDSRSPICSVSVTRYEDRAEMRLHGTAIGHGSLRMMLDTGYSTKSRSFTVIDDFDFDSTYHLSKSIPMIPMTFMFTSPDANTSEMKQYVCHLSFIHEDGSALDPREADGVDRTNGKRIQ